MAFISKSFSILLIFLIEIASYASGKVIPNENTLKCEFYEEVVCTDPQNNCTSLAVTDESNEEENSDGRMIECSNNGRENYCFALWSNDSLGRVTIKKKGCLDDVNCEDRTSCVSAGKRRNLYYCCCDGDLCNSNFSFDPELIDDEIDEEESSSITGSLDIVIPVLVIITCCGLLMTFFYSFCKRKSCDYDQNANFDPKLHSDSSASLEKLLPIELIEVKAKGRFGEVWKAFSKIKNEYVAVKIFPSEDKQSWLTEREVFMLPHMEHENILAFIMAEKRYESPLPKYWLITAYHERGSLCEYLKNNTVTWEELCLISFTMARGLAHLHDEKMPLKASDFYKPPIAHRDFKSSNVLLKEDLTACIADFGLAIIFKDTQLEGNNHRRQVGTRRYMAPEILHGWMNFSATSFQYVDVYACGLVLWEILSRCTVHEDATAKYKLPFQEELGEHPSIDEMRELVVNNKFRPVIKESWKNHPLLSEVCETIEETWDPDPEARASASCVAERFSGYLRSQHSSYIIRT